MTECERGREQLGLFSLGRSVGLGRGVGSYSGPQNSLSRGGLRGRRRTRFKGRDGSEGREGRLPSVVDDEPCLWGEADVGEVRGELRMC